MNRTIRHLTIAVLAAASTACTDLVGGDVIHGNRYVVSELRSTPTFNAISNATAADVEILQSAYDRVRVIGEENLLPYLRTRVVNGELRIYTDPGIVLRPNDRLVIEVDMGTLYAITSSGSGDITAPLIDARALDIMSSGAGDIEVPRLLTDSVAITSSGSGSVLVDGETLHTRIVHSGSGRVDTGSLDAYYAHATHSGSGTVVVRARDTLRAILSGSGHLRYYGSPRLDATVTGSGRVERAGS